jgi:integrase
MIDEAVEDLKRDVRERRDVVKTRLLGFYNWLVKDFVVHSGRKENKEVRKGLHGGSAQMFVNAVRSFYSTFDITVKLKGRQRLPRVKVFNKRMLLSTVDVKTLLDHARSPRDRAIILTMYQSGMDVSTLCQMTYSDIADGLAKNEYPLKLELHRSKTGTDYNTFLGKDAIGAIKAYLNDAKSRGVQFKNNTPLFVQEVKGKKREPLSLDTNLVQKIMREVAVRSGFVDSENNGKDQNPVSPHSLRESFGSAMINSGVPDTIVDFWLGHEIGQMAEAYKGVQFESLKQLYTEKEKLISVGTSESDAVKNVEAALSKQIIALSERVGQLESDLKTALEEIEHWETGGEGYDGEDWEAIEKRYGIKKG